jgi:hypothetical protein
MLELIRDGISHAEMNPLLADDFLQVLHTLHQQAMRGTDKGAWQHLMPLRYPPPASCGLAATESPRNLLANLGLVAGMWLDFPRGGIPHYWRLCWVTPFRGHCVLRHYESRSTRVISTAELRAELSLRTAVIVNDLGLVSSAVGRSFKQVNESIRSRGRAQSADVSRPDASASGSTPDEDVRHPALS